VFGIAGQYGFTRPDGQRDPGQSSPGRQPESLAQQNAIRTVRARGRSMNAPPIAMSAIWMMSAVPTSGRS